MGEDPVPVVVRSSAGEYLPAEALESVDITAANGMRVPLSQIARLESAWRPAAIKHRNSRRVVTVSSQLADVPTDQPIVAVTDSMKAVADQIGRFVEQPWAVLGTDGFGRSDTRENLRRYFEIDAGSIAYAALVELARLDKVPMETVLAAREKLSIDEDGLDPARTDEIASRPAAKKPAKKRKAARK